MSMKASSPASFAVEAHDECAAHKLAYYPGQPAQLYLARAAPLLILVCAYLQKGRGLSGSVVKDKAKATAY